MNDFCRCDNPTVVDDRCINGGCGQLIRADFPLLHTPPTCTTFAPPLVIEERPPWRVCPDCSAHNNEHKPRCPRANWNVDKCVKAVWQR